MLNIYLLNTLKALKRSATYAQFVTKKYFTLRSLYGLSTDKINRTGTKIDLLMVSNLLFIEGICQSI